MNSNHAWWKTLCSLRHHSLPLFPPHLTPLSPSPPPRPHAPVTCQYGLTSGFTLGVWTDASRQPQYVGVHHPDFYNAPYTCLTFRVPLSSTCNPTTSQYTLATGECRWVQRSKCGKCVGIVWRKYGCLSRSLTCTPKSCSA